MFSIKNLNHKIKLNSQRVVFLNFCVYIFCKYTSTNKKFMDLKIRT